MTLRLAIICVACFVSSNLEANSQTISNAVAAWTAGPYWCAIGDSVIAGYSNYTPYNGSGPSGLTTCDIARMVFTNSLNSKITGTNFAIQGSEWGNLANTQTPLALSVHPKYLYCAAGVNDERAGLSFHPQIDVYMNSIKAQCIAAGTTMIVGPILPGSTTDADALAMRELNTNYFNWCNTNNALYATLDNTPLYFFNLTGVIRPSTGYYDDDIIAFTLTGSLQDVHRSPQGISAYATNIVNYLVSLGPQDGPGTILPPDRMGPWIDSVGVEGGVPDSSTMLVYSNIAAGASAATISGACSTCPSNQVVALGAGTFNLTNTISYARNGVVLRGSGISNTVVNFTSTFGGIYCGNGNFNSSLTSPAGVADISSGYTQGSSNLVFSTVSGLAVGNVVVMDQTNDTYFVRDGGYQADSFPGRGAGARTLQQMFKVTAINGNTVTVWPPVAVNFWSASLFPQVFWITSASWLRRNGVENMTINMGTAQGAGVYSSDIGYESCINCWVKNVQGINAHVSHVGTYGCYRCEVRHSYFIATQSAATQSYGITGAYTGSELVEDNIFVQITGPLVPSANFSLSVFGYNCATNMYYTSTTGFLMASMQPHDPHVYMNLFEGNWGTKFDADYIHGSGSHTVLFRNRLTGYESWSFGGGPSTQNIQCEVIDITNRYDSSVGNILGTSGHYSFYASIPGNRHNNNAVYSLGMENQNYGLGLGDDTNTYLTFFKHMDYDVVTGAITYNPTNADVALPNSLYLTSKPAFFGVLNWSPFNPTNTTAAATDPTNLPAGYRLAFGVDPPSSATVASSISLNSATIQMSGATMQISQ